MKCIGIDPSYAKDIAFAYATPESWFVGLVAYGAIIQGFTDVFKEAKERGVNACIIEDGFVGQNPKVAMKLAEVRAELQTVATMAGLPVRRVAPATWQSAMLSQGRYRPKTHAEIARMLDLRVCRGYGLTDINEDQQVAVLLAEWGEAQQWMEGG